MIDEKRFSKRWTVGTKEFGYLKKPWTISTNNVRSSASKIDKADIKTNLAPNIKSIGLQQLPVVDGKGEVFIGGRRTVACEINGKENLLVEVRDIPDIDQMTASWGENYVKRDMRADQEGRLFERMGKKFGLSERELAKKLGVGKDAINRKIRAYNEFFVSRNETVPHNSTNDSAKAFNFGKAIELLPLHSKQKDRMLKEIKTKGMTVPQVREIIKHSNAMISVADTFDEPKKTAILTKIEPNLFRKELKPEKIIYDINEVAGASHKVSPHKIPKEQFTTQKEADDEYFIPRGGRCLGDTTEQYWYGTVNRQKHRKLEKVRKEAEKNERSNAQR